MADLTAAPKAGVAGQPACRPQVGEPLQERLHVGAAQRGGLLTTVSTCPQALRQARQAADVVADGQPAAGGPASPQPPFGQVVGGPSFGGLPQPALADAGEVHRAGVAEHHQIPHVAVDLGLGGGQRPAGMGAQTRQQPLERKAAAGLADRVDDRGDLLGAQRSADRPQVGLLGLDSIDPAALLQADQHLGDHQRREATKADLAADPDRRLGLAPPGLVQDVHGQPTRRGGSPGGTQPLLVRLAVATIGMAALARAGSHPAGTQGRQRNGQRVGAERGGTNAERPLEPQVATAQRRRGGQLLPLAPRHRTPTGTAHRDRAHGQPLEPLDAQPTCGQPRPARGTDPAAGWRRGLAARSPAGRPA